MNKKTQSGFAHLIIITVILALAVVGLLGFVFWQNFIQTKTMSLKTTNQTSTTKSSTLDSTKKSVIYKTVGFDSTKTISASYNVPDGWKVEKTYKPDTDDYGGMETIKITSPDADVIINTSATNASGIGGTCDPENDANTYHMFTSYEVKNFYIKTNLVETVVKNAGTYYFKSQMSNPFDYSDVAMLGKSACEGMFADMIPYKSPSGIDGYFQSEIQVVSLTKHDISAPEMFNSMATIDAALASPNYITARNILLSLKG